MAAQVLYHSRPTKGSGIEYPVVEPAPTMVPYIVSGPLSREYNIVGILGAVLHVACWVLAFIFDGLLAAKIHQTDDANQTATDKRAWAYWTLSMILLSIAITVLLVLTVGHAVRFWKIKEGAIPPVFMTLISGGAVIINLMAFLLVETNPRNLFGYTNLTDVDEKKAFENDFLTFALLALLSKIYVWQFISNNQVSIVFNKKISLYSQTAIYTLHLPTPIGMGRARRGVQGVESQLRANSCLTATKKQIIT